MSWAPQYSSLIVKSYIKKKIYSLSGDNNNNNNNNK